MHLRSQDLEVLFNRLWINVGIPSWAQVVLSNICAEHAKAGAGDVIYHLDKLLHVFGAVKPDQDRIVSLALVELEVLQHVLLYCAVISTIQNPRLADDLAAYIVVDELYLAGLVAGE